MRDLSDYYTQEYLTESAPAKNLKGAEHQDNTLQPHADVEAAVEYDDLEFDLGDELNQETYYAGGDEGDSRNKGVTPKIKRKRTAALKKESFNDLVRSVLVSEMDDFAAEDDFAGDYEDDFEGEDETVEVSASVIRDIISQLEGLVGGGYEEDDYADDGFEDDFEDDFAEESWDGGAGDQRMKGDYSGKARGQSGSNLNDKGKAKVSAKPNNTEGSEGDERLSGCYDGKAKKDRGTTHLKGGKNSNKASGKTPYKKTPNPEEDLFGV